MQADRSGKRKPIPMRQAMLKVVRTLRRAGFEALLAGGCVRDKLLGKRPKDYDIATNAVPEVVVKLFPRSLTVGAQFGVVVVMIGGRQIEVATFRSDLSYQDGRHPGEIVFTDARHDAERRDFTINGMFYDPLDRCVIDFVGGRQDLRDGIVRAIGDPYERFAEDHLRMLRATRFAGRLQFQIEPRTRQAIIDLADRIRDISVERVLTELDIMLVDPNRADSMRLVRDTGLLPHILPGLSGDKLEAGIETLDRLPRRVDTALALAALLVDCPEKEVGSFCRHLKTSNELRQKVTWLVGNRQRLLDHKALSKGSLKLLLAEPLFESLVMLSRARLKAAGKKQTALIRLRKRINALGDEPIAPPPLLDGHELIKLGVPEGPQLGRMIKELYLAQLEGDVTTKGDAQKWVRERFKV